MLIDDGKTLRDVLAARPSSDYDAIYASNDESWTGTELVTAIYRDLSGSEL